MTVNQASYRQPRESPKSRLVALILCLTLGYLGAHRFYAGKIASGFVWLCTGGLFYIGWFIDCILILTGSLTDERGLPISNWEGYTEQPKPTAQPAYQQQPTPQPQQPMQPQPQTPKSAKYCPTCGVSNEIGSTYCASCGSVLDL